MTHHSPLQQIREAKQIASSHGLRVVPVQSAAGAAFVLYRNTPGGSIRLGRRSSATGILDFVKRCAATH